MRLGHDAGCAKRFLPHRATLSGEHARRQGHEAARSCGPLFWVFFTYEDRGPLALEDLSIDLFHQSRHCRSVPVACVVAAPYLHRWQQIGVDAGPAETETEIQAFFMRAQ